MAAEMPASFLDKVKAMADEMGLEDDARENFIGQVMTKKGYTPKKQEVEWIPPEGSNETGPNQGKGWF